MKAACRVFASGGLPDHLALALPNGVSADTRFVAAAFDTLQTAGHNADYNTRLKYSRQEASDYVQLAEKAFAAWSRVRASHEAKIFLISLLLWKQWNR